jgi:hypothetical protein
MSSSVVSGCRKRYARNAVSYVFFFFGLSSAAVAVAVVVDDIMSNGLGNDANMSLIWTTTVDIVLAAVSRSGSFDD